MKKNLSLNVKEFEEYLWDTEEVRILDKIGIRYVFRFPNDYGASVIKHYGSLGYEQDLWELGVLQFDFPDEYFVVYPHQIVEAGMTKGNLTEEEIYNNLKLIKDL